MKQFQSLSWTVRKPIPAPESVIDSSAGDFWHPRSSFGPAFWQRLPGFASVPPAEFNDFRFQMRRTIFSAEDLAEALGSLVSSAFLADVHAGISGATMRMRVTPYILSLIDWVSPQHDPIRRQFIPLLSERLPDHPLAIFDALGEKAHATCRNLIHRYPDKVLFLSHDVCPVYCQFCTRSYAIGSDTQILTKVGYHPDNADWAEALEYIATHPQVRDVVVSGGDTCLLPAHRIHSLGKKLLQIPHVQRVRIATKVLSVIPMKIVSDEDWTEAILDLARVARELGKALALHTHFNHPREISAVTRQAMRILFQNGLRVRNQSVLLRGVNDSTETMAALIRELGDMNIDPYYVFVHDFIPGVEHLRTSLQTALEMEREIRGRTAGFLSPTFVCDLPGGGGKRDAHSFDRYDPENGISVFRSPALFPDGLFLFFDPTADLSPVVQKMWQSPRCQMTMIRRIIADSGFGANRVMFSRASSEGAEYRKGGAKGREAEFCLLRRAGQASTEKLSLLPASDRQDTLIEAVVGPTGVLWGAGEE